MLTDFDLGRLKQALLSVGTVAGAARTTGFSRNTIRAAIKRNFKPATCQRATSMKVKIRQRIVAMFARQRCHKQHRIWPKYSSARQMKHALFNRTREVVSVRQIQRDLHNQGLKPYVRKAQPTRNRVDLQKKRAFARRNRRIAWKRVVFSDESWLCCNERTGRIQWARSRHEVLGIEQKARWNVPSIMVWGTVGYNFKGPLIIFPSKVSKEGELRQFRLDAAGYVRRCLSKVVPRLVQERRLFQHDGARAHAARSTTEYLQRKGVQMVECWPPYCPDLNAIERIWKELSERVGARCPLTVEELISVALEEWVATPQSLINAHCKHFPKQLADL